MCEENKDGLTNEELSQCEDSNDDYKEYDDGVDYIISNGVEVPVPLGWNDD